MQLNDYIPKLKIVDMGAGLYVFYITKANKYYYNVIYFKDSKYARVVNYPETGQFSLYHKKIRLVDNLTNI